VIIRKPYENKFHKMVRSLKKSEKSDLAETP